MARYGYSYRTHNPHDEFDPWETERSHNSKQLCHPALDEFEGRRMIAGDPYENPGTHVMKIETTVEHVHPSMFSESYRQCSPPRYEQRSSYRVVNNKPHGPSIRSNDRPPVVEEFFNKIQNEVSQPSGFGAPRAPYQHRIPVSAGYYGTTGDRLPLVEEFPNKIQNEVSKPSGYGAPRAPYQVRIPVSAGYYGTTGNAQDGDHEKERHKPITNTMKGEETDCGDLKAGKILKPPVTTEGFYGPRPGHPTGSVLPSHHISSEREQTIQPPSMIMAERKERRVPNMKLSKPMNDIDAAMEYLKKVADPSSVYTIKDEVPDRGHFKGDKIPKLPVATEGGPAVMPGHPTESILPNNYFSSERGERTFQPLSMNEAGSTVPQNSIPKTMDAREVARIYNGRFVRKQGLD